MTASLEEHLRQRRGAGRRLLVPYVTAGITPGWTDIVRAYEDAGADAVEIGIPFSDPMLDGPTIQEASARAVAAGTTLRGTLAELAGLRTELPLIAMTYGNMVEQTGPARLCAALQASGIRGLIVPDVPLDEAGELKDVAVRENVDLVLLAAPFSPLARLREIAETSRGFVYAVTVMGTTGEREQVPESAKRLALDLKELADRLVLLGFGISTPGQAAALAPYADGIVIASALMRRVLDGVRPAGLRQYVADIRHALDQGSAWPASTYRSTAPSPRI